MSFDKWVSDNGGTFADETDPNTAFTMPGENATVHATYKYDDAEGVTPNVDPSYPDNPNAETPGVDPSYPDNPNTQNPGSEINVPDLPSSTFPVDAVEVKRPGVQSNLKDKDSNLSVANALIPSFLPISYSSAEPSDDIAFPIVGEAQNSWLKVVGISLVACSLALVIFAKKE